MAAQKVEKVQVSGTVAKVEHVRGEFTDRETGAPVTYDFHEVRVIQDTVELSVVRIVKGGPVELPARGARLRFNCDARAAGGAIKLTAESVEQLDDASPVDVLAYSAASGL